jgi:hypothetical protein
MDHHMAKSNRRKKQDRAKAEARRAEQARLKASAERDRQRDENFTTMLDPRTTAPEVARLLMTEGANSLLGGLVARGRQLSGATAEDLAETSRLLLEDSPEGPGLNVLSFAMAAAHAGGDEDAEDQHRADLLARATALDSADPEDPGPMHAAHGSDGRWVRAVREVALLGHPGEVADLLQPYLAQHPGNEQAISALAAAAGKSYEVAKDNGPGSERAQAALARFADRSGLIATREAVLAFLDRTPWGDVVRDRVAAQVAEVPDEVALNWPAAERDAYTALAREVAILTMEEGEDEDEDAPATEIAQGLQAGERRLSLLADFAADRQVPEALARYASAWDEHARFGVWQLADPVPQPGVWVTDLVCGDSVYAEFPAEILDQAGPWAVWAGCLVPLDGVWRSTGTGLLLSPAEGDAVAQYAERATQMILLSLAGVPREQIPDREPIPFGRAEPYGVRWEYEEPMPAGFADLAGKTVSAVLMEVAREVARHRATPPRLQNTDGDPLLLIDATISVTGNVTDLLLAHPDFALAEDPDHSDGGEEAGTRLEWWGRPVPAAQAAQLRAQLGDTLTEPGQEQEQRWLRGSMTVTDGIIAVSVNSRKRLDRLVRILAKLGAAPVVTAESRVDPALDLAWGTGAWPGAVGAAPAPDGWEKAWLDERIPALDGLTPREAAEGNTASVMRLESLLRQFEYRAGLAGSADGNGGVDVAWLRTELGLQDD